MGKRPIKEFLENEPLGEIFVVVSALVAFFGYIGLTVLVWAAVGWAAGLALAFAPSALTLAGRAGWLDRE